MYAIDRRHKKIIQNDEFQHHGVEGQKWGIITKFVGVNYIPTGERTSSSTNNQTKSNSSDSSSDPATKYVRSANKEFTHVTDKMMSKVINNPTVKNASNEKEYKRAINKIINNAAWDQFDNLNKYLQSMGIDPWGNSFFDNKVLPGQTMSRNQAEFNFYNKGAIDVTKDAGYSFNTPNAPKMKVITYNGIPTGEMCFYNNKIYYNMKSAMNDYTKDLKKSLKQ